MTVLFLDTETFSEVPLRDGTHRYAERAEVMIVSWAVNDEPVQVHDLTADHNLPDRLVDLLEDEDVTVVMHNGGMFDRVVIRAALGIDLPPERIHDTMVQALAHGMPGSLDVLCAVMNVPRDMAKHKDGKTFIQLFCKPRSKTAKIRRATRHTHPVEWQRFLDYAGGDISSMRYLYKHLPNWNYKGQERALWVLDQKINDRGVAVDVDLAEKAMAAVAVAQAELKLRVREATNEEVQSATKRDQLLAYILKDYGVELPDMKSSTLERRIADPDLPEGLKELLRIRLSTSTTSTTKYAALLRSVSADGRLRGTLQFCGASRTGRWAGRIFQPQNLMRPNMKADDIELGTAALKAGCADLLYDDVMKLTSNTTRGCLVAPEGKKLVISDLSNIEGRFAAWLAGEEWKLQAFRDYDQGIGADLYKLAYARAFNISPLDVESHQRQIGKVMELALGYEGGVGAFVTFALTYKMDLDELAEAAYPTLPHYAVQQAEIMLAWRRKKGLTTYGLDDKVFVVCEAFKALWREAHPEISSYWKELQAAAIDATLNPGVTITARKLKLRRDGAWLRLGLPSGRALCYAAPEVKGGRCRSCQGVGMIRTGGFMESPTIEVIQCPDCEGKGDHGRQSLTYMGLNQYTRKWQRLHTYGGKLFENATQAGARDVMTDRMLDIETDGYEIVLTVHDELLTETPDDQRFTSQRLSALMATNPSWAPGLPLAAAGFETSRYRKD